MSKIPSLEEMLKLYTKKDLWERIQQHIQTIDQLKQQLEESFTEEDVESLIEDRDKTIKFMQKELAEKDCRIEELEGQFAYECECNKQLVDLQKQLAEKDKEINSLIADYEKRISQEQELMSNMEHRLTEKDEELRKYKSYKTDDERIKDLTNLYSQYKEENNQLKKELKDKDFALECKERDIKAIERQRDKAYDDYGYLDKISRELGLQNVDYEKQIALLKSSEKCLTERIKNQTQLAIQELEKVKDWLNEPFDEDGCFKIGGDLIDFIDQQIKLLKGEKDAEN